MVPPVDRKRRCRVSGVAVSYPESRRRSEAHTAPASTERTTSRATLRGTAEARASTGDPREPLLDGHAPGVALDEGLGGGGAVVGDEDGGRLVAQAANHQLAHGAGGGVE